MSHTRDEHLYHELLVHPALLGAKNRERILIIGGSEGATLREILRHSTVQNVTMVDIDKGLVDVCRTYLPMMHQGSFASPKAQILYEDGAHFVRHLAPESFDVVIVDGIDFDSEGSDGYGNSLFAADFYKDVFRSLRTGGVLVQYMSHVDRRSEMQRAGFNQTVQFGVDIPSYFGEGARFSIATKQLSVDLKQRLPRLVAEASVASYLAYLNPDTMKRSLLHTARRLKGGGGGGGGGGGSSGSPVMTLVFSAIMGLSAWCFCCWLKKRMKDDTDSSGSSSNE